jgi:hypothetical protein
VKRNRGEPLSTSSARIAKVYSHVREKKSLLMDAVNMVRPG